MEVITGLMRAHTNQSSPRSAANEGAYFFFLMLSYCVAQLMAGWDGCFHTHEHMGVRGVLLQLKHILWSF